MATPKSLTRFAGKIIFFSIFALGLVFTVIPPLSANAASIRKLYRSEREFNLAK